MELCQLIRYAEQKFHIPEQHKWADFPQFSVLADPHTNKWVALLMRQWDEEAGAFIERCDLKCGQEVLRTQPWPFLSPPFRMKGQNWVGVSFGPKTISQVVCRLFDRAVRSGEGRGYTFELDGKPVTLPASDREFSSDWVLDGPPRSARDTPLPASEIPPKIREMQKYYYYADGSFRMKCWNFYRQGKFMETYEDDAPWEEMITRYYPTYHDFNIRQLRGYFSWRTRVRKGDFSKAPATFVFLYLYELLNGIGTRSPEDGFEKMQAFEKGYLDAGLGNAFLRRQLYRWMCGYAVLSNFPPETARRYLEPDALARDEALAVLAAPETAEDGAVLDALGAVAGKRLEQSPAFKKDASRARRLFAAAWRQGGGALFAACFGKQASYHWTPLPKAIYFELHPHPDADYTLDRARAYRCRGGDWWEVRYEPLHFDHEKLRAFLRETDRRLRRALKAGHYLRENPEEAWAAPFLEAALQEERRAQQEAARPKFTIELSALEKIRADAAQTRDSLLTEAEMDAPPVLEHAKNTTGTLTGNIAGNATKSMTENLSEYMGNHPVNITKNSSENAPKSTTENLPEYTGNPTENPTENSPGNATKSMTRNLPEDTGNITENITGNATESMTKNHPEDTENITENSPGNATKTMTKNLPEYTGNPPENLTENSPRNATESNPKNAPENPKNPPENTGGPAAALDGFLREILDDLLSGKSVEARCKARHVLPTVAADTINEAFFDEISDSILDCDGETIALVADYKDDVLQLLGGEHP